MGWVGYRQYPINGWSYCGNSKSYGTHYNCNIDVYVGRGTGNTYYVQMDVTLSPGDYDYDPGTLYLQPDASPVSGLGNQVLNSFWYIGSASGGTVTVSIGSATVYQSGNAVVVVSIPGTINYTVSFNGNDATGGYIAPQSVLSGSAITLPANAYTRTGYTFVQWNTAANGTGTGYSPGTAYTPPGNATLYAIWQIDTYAITYNGNGATGGSTAGQTKTYGIDITISANGFTRDKYIFLYWNTASDGTGTTYEPGDIYSTNAAMTLYAIWKKANIPLYVNDNNTIRQIEKAYMNVGGQIKECTVYANVNGEIKEFA